MIEAHRRYYSFSICPGFWQAVVRHHGAGQICSIDRVFAELTCSADTLGGWAKTGISPSFFQATSDAQVVAAYAKISRWVHGAAQYWPATKKQFLDGADPWLVAYCAARGCTLVTQEAPAPQARNKVPIPNVCQAFSVPTCNTFELLNRLPAAFSLSP